MNQRQNKRNTPQKREFTKNKNEDSKNLKTNGFETFSTVFNIIIGIVSIILTIITYIISVKMNDFTKKMSPLNYSLEKIGDTTPMVFDEITYTTTPFKFAPEKDEISGEFSSIIIAYNRDEKIDMFEISNEMELPWGCWSDLKYLFLVDSISDDELTFQFSDLQIPREQYGYIHIILKAYNGDYSMYTMVYSPLNYQVYLLNNIDVNSYSRYAEIIESFGLSVSEENLKSEIKESRKTIYDSLNS